MAADGRSRRIEDNIESRFGSWTVLRQDDEDEKRWICRCDCGKEKSVVVRSLFRDKSKCCSRGCPYSSRWRHELKAERSAYKSMKARCYCAGHGSYKDYGGRGIRVCQGWRVSRQHFLDDLGSKPTPEHTLDRIDTNGHYSCGKCEECVQNGWPANCRWATRIEQLLNRRNTRLIEHDGRSLTVYDWARVTGIHRNTIALRLESGWSVEDALTRPPDRWASRRFRRQAVAAAAAEAVACPSETSS